MSVADSKIKQFGGSAANGSSKDLPVLILKVIL